MNWIFFASIVAIVVIAILVTPILERAIYGPLDELRKEIKHLEDEIGDPRLIAAARLDARTAIEERDK